MQEMGLQSLGWEDPLEKEMATHFSILAWEIPWTEEPGGQQSMGSQRVDTTWQLKSNNKQYVRQFLLCFSSPSFSQSFSRSHFIHTWIKYSCLPTGVLNPTSPSLAHFVSLHCHKLCVIVTLNFPYAISQLTPFFQCTKLNFHWPEYLPKHLNTPLNE